MWTFEHRVETTASAAELWARYEDPTTWPAWDHGLAKVVLDGPCTAGTTGPLHPVRGSRSRFRLTAVEPLQGFADVTRLPLGQIAFSHRIEAGAAGCEVVHRVEISGPLGPLWVRLIGRGIARDMPTTMGALARLATSAREPAVSG